MLTSWHALDRLSTLTVEVSYWIIYQLRSQNVVDERHPVVEQQILRLKKLQCSYYSNDKRISFTVYSPHVTTAVYRLNRI